MAEGQIKRGKEDGVSGGWGERKERGCHDKSAAHRRRCAKKKGLEGLVGSRLSKRTI